MVYPRQHADDIDDDLGKVNEEINKKRWNGFLLELGCI